MNTEIDRAILNHGKWKRIILNAIETRQCNWSVEFIKSDLNCDFGKWLKSLSQAEKENTYYETAIKLHKEFHICAAHVLDLALNGKEGEALEELEFGKEYKTISSKLTKTLMEWKTRTLNI